MEEWRSIKGYEGLYEVSNMGRVRSVDRSVSNNDGSMFVKGKILKPSLSKNNGYYFVDLSSNGKRKHVTVHRLVAEAFIPNHDNKSCIDHINTVRTDNRVENLRWCTQRENCNNPISVKRMSDSQECKSVAQYTLNGKLIAVYPSISAAARQNSYNMTAIRNCCNGKYFHSIRQKWVSFTQYKGYIWKYHQI